MGCGVSLAENQNGFISGRRTGSHVSQHSRMAGNRYMRMASTSSTASSIQNTIDGKERKLFVHQFFKLHNKKRALHGVSPLHQSTKLANHAQKWAEHMAQTDMTSNSKMKLPNGEKIGENLHVCWSSNNSLSLCAIETVTSWYDERKYYNNNHVSFTDNTGNFTQMIWKTTKTMGVGVSRSSSGNVYIVANYRPAGNLRGRFKQNVPLAIIQSNQNDRNNNNTISSTEDNVTVVHNYDNQTDDNQSVISDW